MNKEDNIKEKFKQALISTVKVISDEYQIDEEFKKNLSSKNYNFFELDNLNNRIRNTLFDNVNHKFNTNEKIVFNNYYYYDTNNGLF